MSHRKSVIDALLRVIWNAAHTGLQVRRQESYAYPFVRNDAQNAFVNRVIAFRAELEYAELVAGNSRIRPGGWFVPESHRGDPLSRSCYFSVVTALDETTERMFHAIAGAADPARMYAIVPRRDTDLQAPGRDSYDYFRFDAQGSRFVRCSADGFFGFWACRDVSASSLPDMNEGENLYVTAFCRRFLDSVAAGTEAFEMLLLGRHLFDVELSRQHRRGRPTDIDFMKLRPDGSVSLIDVKYKYPSREGMLGVNADHLGFFGRIDRRLGTDTQCVVLLRERRRSTAAEWIYTPMKKFRRGETRKGRRGMNAHKAELTVVLPVSEFTLLPCHQHRKAA